VKIKSAMSISSVYWDMLRLK